MKLELIPYNLHLKHTFTISRESHDVQPTLIVKLELDGEYGLGESTSNPYYGVTIPGMISAIEKKRSIIETWEFEDPIHFNAKLLEWFPEQPFIRCALDMAAHDLFGKLEGQPLYKLWELDTQKMPLSNFTIGLDSVDVMRQKIKEMPWPIYKVKLGTDNDLDIIKALRETTDAIFRIDANCAWDGDKTITLSHELKALGVEFIEQPMPAEDLHLMPEVYKNCALPVIADESCQVVSDVAKCAGKFHGINIKLTKCGGLTPALAMIKMADELGLKKMVGCMTESSVGISAIAHLLPLLDYVDMDGAILLKKDIADGVKLDFGKAIFPNRPGTGAELL